MASSDPLLIGRWQGYAFLATLRICPHCHFNFDPLGGQREGGAYQREQYREATHPWQDWFDDAETSYNENTTLYRVFPSKELKEFCRQLKFETTFIYFT